jgi:hypothetical protein
VAAPLLADVARSGKLQTPDLKGLGFSRAAQGLEYTFAVSPMLDFIFNEWLVGFGVPILIGVGFALVGDEFKEYKAARWCFCISAAWMYGKVLMWSLSVSTFRVRAIVVFLVFGIVGVGLMEVLRLTNRREREQVKATGTTESVTPAAPTNSSSQPTLSGSEKAPGTSVPPVHTAPPKAEEPQSSVTFSAYLQPKEPYTAGTLLAGIVWNEQYVDVRVDITNGETDIQNLDFLVSLDTSIAAVGQISQFPGVTAFPNNSPPASWLQGTDEQGHPLSIPITPIPGTMRAAPVYRVRCSEVFANTVVHLVVASIAMNPVVNGQWPQQLFAPRRPPQKIRIKGTYETRNGKPHDVELAKDFTPQ